jgi:S-adenosylmethionine:tRNA ribosyltransferase-isomerase
MRTDDFDFVLPEDRIALRPARPRTSARLLGVQADGDGEALQELTVADLPRLLAPGDMLVFNDTRVLRAQLTGRRSRETRDGAGMARIGATLIERLDAARWRVLARPARRLAAGDLIDFGTMTAQVEAREDGGLAVLRFDRAGEALDAAIETCGRMPLPPYITARREADAQDDADYQTMFAEKTGSVAAPTASLHFDEGLTSALAQAGVRSARLTLHVGAGTFLPVKTDDPTAHRMHAEWGEIAPEAAEAINAARREGGRIVAVGTTALRLLESAADAEGRVAPWRGETDIFIAPGHRFRAVDGLMTNFHLPRSTLFMLVCALMGLERMRRIYAHAIATGYRFYSYGDSSLLMPGR